MKSYPPFHECRSYVAAHLNAKDHPQKKQAKTHFPAITISRQAGARGRTIGQKLQNKLRAAAPKAAIPWTLFDENLVKQVLEDHNLPSDLEKFMPDDAVSELESSINEILGRHPSLWSLFEKTVETIFRLSRMGNCIIVGRGANKVTRGLSNVLHVRFIGSQDKRIRQMVTAHNMPTKAAKAYVLEEDAARKRYMKKHFNTDIEDASQYDLVINTDCLSDEIIVDILISALRSKEK